MRRLWSDLGPIKRVWERFISCPTSAPGLGGASASVIALCRLRPRYKSLTSQDTLKQSVVKNLEILFTDWGSDTLKQSVVRGVTGWRNLWSWLERWQLPHDRSFKTTLDRGVPYSQSMTNLVLEIILVDHFLQILSFWTTFLQIVTPDNWFSNSRSFVQIVANCRCG